MNPIEHFVRGTLGCQCPDEVFQSISIDRSGTADDAASCTRLLVGHRLLIYVLDAASFGVAESALADLVARGRRERDERGYNRFAWSLPATSRRPQALPSSTRSTQPAEMTSEPIFIVCRGRCCRPKIAV